jgi:hypothetical protein
VAGSRAVAGLRLRTVASRRPRSGQYHPIWTLPASLRDSVLAAQNITMAWNHSSNARTTSDYARIALAGIRIVNGASALLAPRLLAADDSAVYPFRLFGIRTVVIGADLLLRDKEVRDHALRLALLIHASDVASAVVAGARRQVPFRSAATAAAISSVNTALALVARTPQT